MRMIAMIATAVWLKRFTRNHESSGERDRLKGRDKAVTEDWRNASWVLQLTESLPLLPPVFSRLITSTFLPTAAVASIPSTAVVLRKRAAAVARLTARAGEKAVILLAASTTARMDRGEIQARAGGAMSRQPAYPTA
jgi:hypothetical protein